MSSCLLPPDALVVCGVEVGEGPGGEVSAAVGGLHGVAARDAHVPEDHPTGRLLLTLDAEAAYAFGVGELYCISNMILYVAF